MAGKRKIQTLKKKKKKWFSILAPESFGSRELGETFVIDSEGIIGKRVRVNLSFLARTRNQNIRLIFEVNEIKDGNALTKLVSYHIVPGHIKRIVKKGKSKIHMSQIVKTKDGKNLVIKYVIITRNKTSKGVLKTLNNFSRDFVSKELKVKKGTKN